MNIYLNLLGILLALITILVFILFCVNLFFYFIKKKPFPKKLLISSFSGILLVLAIVGYTKYFFTFDNLEGEFYKGPVKSPEGKYTANAYYMNYGGAAGGVNVWVEITYNDEADKIKTVYYSHAKSKFSMKWKDEDTLYIVNEEPRFPSSNRNIELTIGKEIYHESGLACDSLLMKDEYESCYGN